MSNSTKGSLVAGIIYIVLGLCLLGIGVLGVSYRLDDSKKNLNFIQGPNPIGMHQAANLMMPLGFLGGLGAIGFGALRARGGKEEEEEA